MVESNRQKRIAGVLQKDLAILLQNMLREKGRQGIIISVSKVSVTVDLSLAKVYTSIFPADKAVDMVSELNTIKPRIKHRRQGMLIHKQNKQKRKRARHDHRPSVASFRNEEENLVPFPHITSEFRHC